MFQPCPEVENIYSFNHKKKKQREKERKRKKNINPYLEDCVCYLRLLIAIVIEAHSFPKYEKLTELSLSCMIYGDEKY